MLSWSMNLFRIRGIQLSVHVSFILMLAYVAWEGWSSAGGPGAVWSVAYMLTLFACVTNRPSLETTFASAPFSSSSFTMAGWSKATAQ